MYNKYFFQNYKKMEVKQEPSSSMETDEVKDSTNDQSADER